LKSSVIVHQFVIGDVEDPDLYAAEPMIQFEKSPKGIWVLEHALDIPVWTKRGHNEYFGWIYTITAEFEEAALTEWMLRYGDDA